MEPVLVLKSSCYYCNSSEELYGTQCKHLTVCLTCGQNLATSKADCSVCGAQIERVIKELGVFLNPCSEERHMIGKFASGLPDFTDEKGKWTMEKDGLQGRQMITESMREKFKDKPWILENDVEKTRYKGAIEGTQNSNYFVLVKEGDEFKATPVASWYNFNKDVKYNQLTLEEAEEKMRHRKKSAEGYERWMMKSAKNGPAAFGEAADEDEEGEPGAGNGRRSNEEEEAGNESDKAEEEDEDEEEDRKRRLGLNRKGGDDDGEEGPGGDIPDFGEDWEHEEVFTDDDEAILGPEDREHWEAEIPPPPEIGNDDEDEDEDEDEEEEEEEDEEDGKGGEAAPFKGSLSKSGKELKKLLGRAGELNDPDSNLAAEFMDPAVTPTAKKPPLYPGTAAKKEAADKKQGNGKRKVTEESRAIAKKARTEQARAIVLGPSPSSIAASLNKARAENAQARALVLGSSALARQGAFFRHAKTQSLLARPSPIQTAPLRMVKPESVQARPPSPSMAGRRPVSPFVAPSPSPILQAPLRKVKIEAGAPSASMAGTSHVSPVSETELRAYIAEKGGQVNITELHDKFKRRLPTKEDQTAFVNMMRGKFKTRLIDGEKCVVLKQDLVIID